MEIESVATKRNNTLTVSVFMGRTEIKATYYKGRGCDVLPIRPSNSPMYEFVSALVNGGIISSEVAERLRSVF